jgi:integrase
MNGETFAKIERHLYKRQYQTADGQWRTAYHAVFTDWKKIRRKFSVGDNLDDARDELGRLHTLNKGRHDWDAEKKERAKAKQKGMTLFLWIERFYQVKASKRSLSKDKESAAKIEAHFGNCGLDTINTSAIEAYKQKRLTEKSKRGKTPAPATINREVAFLRTLLKLAARDRLIEYLPHFELFEENNERNRTATPEELKAILDHSDEHLKEILFCLWDTGMRKSEALKLEWDRIDFKNEVIKLGALAKDGQVDTKAKQARIVPMSPRLKAILLAIRQREKSGKVLSMTGHSNRVFLFRGKPFKRFDRAFKTACEKANVEELWIHDIRATFATRKIDEGFDRDWVKMITGHRTDNVFKRYNRPKLESLRKVVSGDEIVPDVFPEKPTAKG